MSPDLVIVWNLWGWTIFHSTNIHNKAQVFLGVMRCPLSGSCRHFRGTESLHRQSQAVKYWVAAELRNSAFFMSSQRYGIWVRFKLSGT